MVNEREDKGGMNREVNKNKGRDQEQQRNRNQPEEAGDDAEDNS